MSGQTERIWFQYIVANMSDVLDADSGAHLLGLLEHAVL